MRNVTNARGCGQRRIEHVPPTGPQKTKRKMITIDLKDLFIIVFLATESMPRSGFVAESLVPVKH